MSGSHGSSRPTDDFTPFQIQIQRQMSETARVCLERSLPRRKVGGSEPGKASNIDRGHLEGHLRLFQDYFSSQSTYPAHIFRRRFRMRRELFDRLLHDVPAFDNYFDRKRDAFGKLGMSPLQKITAALRMLAYGASADSLDETLRMSETTAIESLRRFCNAITSLYSSHYLRAPNDEDVAKLLSINSERGFPGMIGSIDCMHWQWQNCPKAWAGQFQGKEGKPTIVLEAVADYELWIWHAFFGMAGSCNDINILDNSTIFHPTLRGTAPTGVYSVNGTEYTRYYYLADGIYPKYACFVQTISSPIGPKKKHFARRQEALRKDVERAFGVLQARWAIIRTPCKLWDKDAMHSVMMTAIILHNMIIEDERGINDLEQDLQDFPETDLHNTTSAIATHLEPDALPSVTRAQVSATFNEITDRQTHHSLQADLIEHCWSIAGEIDEST